MKLKKHATLKVLTYEDDEWVALEKKTHKTLEINGYTKYYKAKDNTEKSRAICVITRKGENTSMSFDEFLTCYMRTLSQQW